MTDRAHAIPGGVAGLDVLAHAAREYRMHEPDTSLALATLVSVEGSSFRQPGARLLIDATNARCIAGAISGGCLEADVAARASEVCRSGLATHLTYDLRDDLQAIWGFDAACDGVAHVLLEPLHAFDWLSAAAAVCQARDGGAIVTIAALSEARGRLHDAERAATYSDSVSSTVNHVGTLCIIRGAGPDAEFVPIQHADDALMQAARAVAATADHTGHSATEDCIVDDQRITLFASPLIPPIALHLIGAGRGAETFARIADAMGWQVSIIDHRPALLDALALPSSVSRLVARADASPALVADAHTAVALLTHMFEVDRAWLEVLIPQSHRYIGVLGSRQRARRLLDALSLSLQERAEATRVLHAPIGLDIGGENPEAIALAAIAEIHAVMHGRPGGPLRERQSPIHERTPTPLRDANSQVPETLAPPLSISCAISEG